MKAPITKGSRRRQVPRRAFEASVGVLYHAEYAVERTYTVSEGGMMISSFRPMREGDLVVVTFKVPSSQIILVRGIIRSVVAPTKEHPERYGMEFQNLEFSAKREIRNFVAAAASYERPVAL